MSLLATAMARPTAIRSKQAMILGSRLLVFSLCCTAGWAAPILYKQDKASEVQSDQGLQYQPEGLERRIVLWLLSLMGFYGLAWLLDDSPMEPCPTWQGAEVSCPIEGCFGWCRAGRVSPFWNSSRSD